MRSWQRHKMKRYAKEVSRRRWVILINWMDGIDDCIKPLRIITLHQPTNTNFTVNRRRRVPRVRICYSADCLEGILDLIIWVITTDFHSVLHGMREAI